MKKIICMLIVVVMCLSIAAPAFAADNGFVPSITYKPNPDIVPVVDEKGNEFIGTILDEKGEEIELVEQAALQITPVADIWNDEKTVSEATEKLLKEVYESLSNASMKLPYEKFNAGLDAANMVIRDLIDVSWTGEEYSTMVAKDGVTFQITFDLGVVADAQIYTMTYDEATKEWSPIVKTVNNGDGTVTCTFEHLCLVAFAMPVAGTNAPVEAEQGPGSLAWIIALAVAVVGVVAVVVIKKKKAA